MAKNLVEGPKALRQALDRPEGPKMLEPDAMWAHMVLTDMTKDQSCHVYKEGFRNHPKGRIDDISLYRLAKSLGKTDGWKLQPNDQSPCVHGSGSYINCWAYYRLLEQNNPFSTNGRLISTPLW